MRLLPRWPSNRVFDPQWIAVGTDGALWYTDTAGKVGRITTEGKITELDIPTADAGVGSIAAGPDGNLWFTEYSAGRIGRVTPDGRVTELPLGAAGMKPYIISGPDGALWFLETNDTGMDPMPDIVLVRMTVDGAMTEYAIPTMYGERVRSFTVGPDQNLWFGKSAVTGPCSVVRFVP